MASISAADGTNRDGVDSVVFEYLDNDGEDKEDIESLMDGLVSIIVSACIVMVGENLPAAIVFSKLRGIAKLCLSYNMSPPERMRSDSEQLEYIDFT